MTKKSETKYVKIRKICLKVREYKANWYEWFTGGKHRLIKYRIYNTDSMLPTNDSYPGGTAQFGVDLVEALIDAGYAVNQPGDVQVNWDGFYVSVKIPRNFYIHKE